MIETEMAADGTGGIFTTREVAIAVDFELAGYWDEGEPLKIDEEWPVCVTLVRTAISIR